MKCKAHAVQIAYRLVDQMPRSCIMLGANSVHVTRLLGWFSTWRDFCDYVT